MIEDQKNKHLEYLSLLEIYKEFPYEWSLELDYIHWQTPARLIFGDTICTGDAEKYNKLLSIQTFEERLRYLQQQAANKKPFLSNYQIELQDHKKYDITEEGEFIFDENGQVSHIAGKLTRIKLIESDKKETKDVKESCKSTIYERLEKVIDTAKPDEKYAFVYISVTRLAWIAINYGMTVANNILKQIEMCLKKSTRHYDFVDRLYGSSFGIILKKCGKDEVIVVAKRLVDNIENSGIQLPNGELATLSVGGSLLEHIDNMKANYIISQAESAMLDSQNIKKIAIPLGLIQRRQDVALQGKSRKRRLEDRENLPKD